MSRRLYRCWATGRPPAVRTDWHGGSRASAGPLHPHDALGGLNLYSTRPQAFDEQDQMLAILLSSLGAVVVDASRQQENLRKAIQSRQIIGEAIAIVRVQTKVSSEQAFEMLSQASQQRTVKLRDLAEEIVRPPADAPPPRLDLERPSAAPERRQREPLR